MVIDLRKINGGLLTTQIEYLRCTPVWQLADFLESGVIRSLHFFSK